MEPTIKSTLDTKTLVLCALIIIGLALTIVGLFGGFLTDPNDASNQSVTISQLVKNIRDEYYDDEINLRLFVNYTYSFVWCTLVFSIVNVIAVIIVGFYNIQNGTKIIGFCSFFNLVFGILVFVFSYQIAREVAGGISYGPLLTLIGSLLVAFSCPLFRRNIVADGHTLFLGGILLTGLILVGIGLCGCFLKETDNTKTTLFSLPFLTAAKAVLSPLFSNATDKEALASITLISSFVWIVFAFSLLCVFAFFATKMLAVKKLAAFPTIIGFLTIIFSIFVLLFAFGMLNKFNEASRQDEVGFSIGYASFLIMIGGILAGIGSMGRSSLPDKSKSPVTQVDSSLQKMKELVNAGILSEEQYEEKKKEISEQRMKEQSTSDINANIKKMKELVDAGFISQEEYEKKKTELESQKSKQSVEYLTVDEMIAHLKAMKDLVEKGILSKEEFETKRTEFKVLKKLRGMVDNGIITPEEYETKKKEITSIYED